MKTRRLGAHGPEVSAIGLGCMGTSEFYGAPVEAESVATLHRALDLGITFLETGDMYGPTSTRNWSVAPCAASTTASSARQAAGARLTVDAPASRAFHQGEPADRGRHV